MQLVGEASRRRRQAGTRSDGGCDQNAQENHQGAVEDCWPRAGKGWHDCRAAEGGCCAAVQCVVSSGHSTSICTFQIAGMKPVTCCVTSEVMWHMTKWEVCTHHSAENALDSVLLAFICSAPNVLSSMSCTPVRIYTTCPQYHRPGVAHEQ